MKLVVFEGTPEEFARVEPMLAKDGKARLVVTPGTKPRTWPELDDRQCYELARRALEKAPAHVRDVLAVLAEQIDLHEDDLGLEEWAEAAECLPEELCGYIAELGRGVGRAFIELFGYASAPESMKGGAYLILEKTARPGGKGYGIRPPARQAMLELGLFEEEVEATSPAPSSGPR